MDPKKFGGLANHKQEPWKAPLPVFIEELYFKRFKKERPDTVKSIERVVKDRNLQYEKRKILKAGSKTIKETNEKRDEIPF